MNEKKFDPKKLQKLNNPQRLKDIPSLTLEESYSILKHCGKIFIVDWKKKDMAEGPPTRIRCLPDQVKEQLMNSGFKRVKIYSELPKHFLLIGERNNKSHNKAYAAEATNRAAD